MDAREIAGDLTSITRFDRHAYMRALEDVDRDAALHLVERCLSRGVSREAVVTELLAPAQREVGQRWEQGQWSVAAEHAATAITDAVLTALSFARPAPTRGSIVVACVEHEWHGMPARMTGLLLGDRGWRVIVLGASVPSQDIGRFVGERTVTAVALSCSATANLLPARRMIEATHACGIRVLVGGAAFGSTPERADALGADAWAGTADHAHAILERWDGDPHAAPRTEPRPDPDAMLLADATHEIAIGMSERLADGGASIGPLAGLLDDGSRTLQTIAAALLIGEPAIVADHVRWLRGVSAARGEEPEYVDVLLGALRQSVAGHPDAARIEALLA